MLNHSGANFLLPFFPTKMAPKQIIGWNERENAGAESQSDPFFIDSALPEINSSPLKDCG